MAKSTILIKDKNFRVTIPYEIRMSENLKVGDLIEIDIIKYISARDELDVIKKAIKHINKSLNNVKYKKIYDKQIKDNNKVNVSE